jgi:copper chaperone NosL
MREGALRVLVGVVLLAVVVGIAWWLMRPQQGPAEVAYDRVACAHCRMLVSEPRFAAQLRRGTGEVLFYDDPGCLLLHRLQIADPESHAWFHDSRSERWLEDERVAFVRVAESPMGYGIAAVPRGTEGAEDGGAALAYIESGR